MKQTVVWYEITYYSAYGSKPKCSTWAFVAVKSCEQVYCRDEKEYISLTNEDVQN